MIFSMLGIFVICTLFILMLLLAALGHKVGRRIASEHGISITEGAIFTLMALLVAFTFSSASARFDQRRILIIDEANAIGTAYLRLDVLEPQDRAVLQKDFLDYVTSRIDIYQRMKDIDVANVELGRSKIIASKLWRDAVKAISHSSITNLNLFVLAPINTMFDVANTRAGYTALHLHQVIFLLLIVVALLSAFITGYGTASRKRWLSVHIIAYSIIMSATIYIILDIEFPRYGIIKASGLDAMLVDVKNTMISATVKN